MLVLLIYSATEPRDSIVTGALHPDGVDVRLFGINFTTNEITKVSLSNTRLGVAFAVNTTLVRDTPSGILGLGANE